MSDYTFKARSPEADALYMKNAAATFCAFGKEPR